VACLNDIEMQRLADDEGGMEQRSHVRECARCAARFDERRRLMADLAATVASAGVPSPALAGRVRESMRAHTPARGATVLRPARAAMRRPLWASLAGAAVVAAIVVFLVLPRVGAPSTLSAAQIIDRSIVQMTGGSGVELLEYELVLASEYRWRAGASEESYRIVQLFDRGNPAHFKFAQFGRDGVLLSATAQDPVQARRTEMQRVDGRNYIVRVTSLPAPLLPLPQMLQTQAEAILRAMQLDGDQHLTLLDDPDGPHYVIVLPSAPPAAAGTPLVLNDARVDIDGRDFRVRAFSAHGMLLGVPFDVSFTLINQIKAAAVAPGDWEIEPRPEDVVIEGPGDGEINDSLSVVLRAIGQMQGR
jgi:hypothetical protein